MAVAAVAPRTAPVTAVPWLVRVSAVSCLFGGEAIHSAVIGQHINEWLPFGLFFLVLSLLEGILAVAVITAPSRWVRRLVVGVSLGTVALWLYSRTLGLSLGPMTGVEPFGRADTIASSLELVTAAILLAPTSSTAPARRSAADYVRAALIVSAVVTLTLLANPQTP